MNKRMIVLAGVLGAALLGLGAAPFENGDVVVFFGDSITHGGLYHTYVSDYYATRFPERSVRFVNSGIGGDTAAGAFPRIPEDVAEYKPTHVAFHFGMNDVNRGAYLPESTTSSLVARENAQRDYRRNLRRLIDGVRKAAPEAKFIYLTPTPYEDTAVITNAPKNGWASFNNVGCNTGLSLMAGFVIASARDDKADVVDWYSVLNGFRVRHQKDDPRFRFVRTDRVHPEELGHSVMAWEFLRRQGVPAVVSGVEIDAGSGAVVRTENAAVSSCQVDVRGCAFTLQAKALPFPVHEKALAYLKEFDVENTLNRETVRLTGLADGLYALKIDGEEVGRYTAQEFAKGVALGFNAKTPQYRQAQEVAARHRALRDRESQLRDHHSARWFFRNHVPDVDDIPSFRAWYEQQQKAGGLGGWKSYFGRFIPGYLEYWPKYREVREQLWKDQKEVRKLARPLPRKYEIALVANLVPHGLVAERMSDPVGLGTARPRLSWKLPDGVSRQTAYEIEADGQPCGKVLSDRQLDVDWPGRTLGSSDRASWRVRVWNERNEVSAWSPRATLSTGLLKTSDWQAKWIGANPKTVPEVDFGAATWLEGTNFEARFKSDRVVDLALGATKPFLVKLNGRLVYKCDGHVFDYRHLRFLDLRPYLADGENVLQVVLTPERFDRKHDPSVAAAIAVLRDAERRPAVTSDAAWGGRALGALRTPDFAAAIDCREEVASPAFEKTFRAKGTVRRATLHVTGLGYYEALLNGRKIGDKCLDPSPTDYDKRVLYSTYLLDGDVRAGENTLTLRLGHGWYDMRSIGMWNYDCAPWRDRPKGIAQLEIEYADGSRETVVTDASWRQVESPVLYDCIREGAVMGPLSAGLPKDLTAAVVPPPRGALEAEMLPATKVVRELAPTEITADGPGRWIVTFPETVSGWVRLTTRGLARGTVVSVEYDENLAPGRHKPKASPPNYFGPWTDKDRLIDVYFVKSGSYRLAYGPGAADSDRFVASGAAVETFEPSFAYHGFRHVVLEGLKEAPSAADIRACHVRTAFPETGSFACSDANLTELVRLARNSYKVNFANGFPTDCPHREKLGWTGDAWIASELGQCYFENTAAYRKWLTDIMDAQTAKGALCGISPTSGWGFAWGNGPVFDAVISMLPWNLWLFRGDRIALDAAYPALLRYLAYEQSAEAEPGLVANGLDDWNAKEKSHKPTAEYVISCLRLEIVETAAKIAEALGKTADVAVHRASAERIRAALRAKYAKGNGVFDNGGQTAQAMAVACGLAAPADRQAVADRLADSVLKTDCHADFGLAGAKYVYRALADVGRADLAYRMIVNPTEPTMMKWIGKNGTLWEDWTFGYSKSHVMLGDFSAWAFEYVAGLRRPLVPGYRTALVEPVLLPGLSWARGETETPYGRLASSWTLSGRDFALAVVVPSGCEAVVRLPDGSERTVGAGTHAFACPAITRR